MLRPAGPLRPIAGPIEGRTRFDGRAWRPDVGDLRQARSRSRRPSPARNAAPSVVASRTGDTSTGFWLASASAWMKVGLADMPPSTRRAGMSSVAVALGRLDEIRAAVSDPLEHRTHDVRTFACRG